MSLPSSARIALRGFVAAAVAIGALAALPAGHAAPAQAAVKPAWCPSPLYNGFAFQVVSSQVYPGRPILASVQTSGRYVRPTTVTVSWARGYTAGSSVTVGFGTEIGNAAIGAVKTSVDASVSRSVTVTRGWSQTLPVPAGRALQWYWAIDMRRTVMRERFITPGCRIARDYGYQTVYQPRGVPRPVYRLVA